VYIIVVGGGRIGYYLAKALIDEGHEILVIEKDAAIVDHIEEDLGSICMHGDGCEAATLEEAGTERAGLFIAVTDEDEDNLVACQVAKHKFNVPRIIARIGNPKNETLFKKLGIDVTISATNLILEYIEQEVPTHSLVRLVDLKRDELEIVEVKISSTSAAAGKRVSELDLPPGSILSLIVKESGVQVPTQETILGTDDRVIAVIRFDLEEALRNILVGS
jgi:trk system potassium uptake protein TrkA